MMTFHPSHRITIDDALKHPFMSSLHNPEDEPVTNFTFQFPFENETLSKERVQELIWEEIHELHPDIPLTYPSAPAPVAVEEVGGGGDERANQKKRMRADSGDKEEQLQEEVEGQINGNRNGIVHNGSGEVREGASEEPMMIRQRTE
jgi:hypothetical protein